MKNYTDYLIESILEESAKTDFIAKFGQETFNNFEKAKQRLVNNGYSTDFGQYLKKDKKEIDDLILSLYNKKDNSGNDIDKEKRRSLQNKQREVRGKYKFFGQIDNYLVYQPLNYIASMDLGINTGWCTTGRYGHSGHPDYTPSEADAEEHFNDYTSRGIKLYYFLNPDTFYGEYAVALYPRVFFIDRQSFDAESKSIIRVEKTNFELFNAADNNIWLNDKIIKIANNIGLNLICKVKKYPDITVDESGVEIKDNTIVKCWNDHIKTYVVPNNITTLGRYAFGECKFLTSIVLPNSVTTIEGGAFGACKSLNSITIPNSVTVIGERAFCDCTSLISIRIPNSVTSIGEGAFEHCKRLEEIYYLGHNPEIINKLTKYADIIDPDTGEVLEIKQK